MALSEIAMINSGKNKLKQAEGEYPVYGSTGIIGYTNKFIYDEDLLLVARVGAYAGLIQKINGKCDISDNTLIINLKKEFNIDYFYHLLINTNLNQYASGGGQPLVTAGKLKTIIVPVPEISEQKRIAFLLNKFNALVSDISIGLPAELNARRSQYEYYRGKLLTFNKYVPA